MRRWRLVTEPPNPRNLFNMNEILQNAKWLNKLLYNRGRMTVRLIISNNSKSLLFFDPQFLRKFDNSSEMVLDATFQVTPKIFGVMQLLVVMLEKFNHVGLNKFYT